MKLNLITVIAILLFPVATLADDKKKDPIEQGLRDAFSLYQKENYSAVSEKLKAVLKLLDERKAERVGKVLPDEVEDWKADELQREDLSKVGGGVSVKRSYTLDEKTITAKLVKDSPLVDQWIKMLANKDLLKLSGKKVHTIDGESALVDSERKILVAIEGEVLLELEGDNDCDSRDILAFARKLDLKTMKKLE